MTSDLTQSVGQHLYLLLAAVCTRCGVRYRVAIHAGVLLGRVSMFSFHLGRCTFTLAGSVPPALLLKCCMYQVTVDVGGGPELVLIAS